MEQSSLIEEAFRVTKSNIILFEDIYKSGLEKKWLKVCDVIGNIPQDRNINFAHNFHNNEEWEEMFKRYNLKFLYKKVFTLYPRFTHHVFYVLEIR